MDCTKKEEKIIVKNNPYIISYEDQKLQEYEDSLEQNNSNIKIRSTKGFFYGESQLVIDTENNLFYYQKQYSPIICNYGNENDTLPHLLDLQPKDIIIIPQKYLSDFISENILTKEKKDRF